MMVATLSIELEAPRIRSEAFPWGAAEVEIFASLSCNTATNFRRARVSLPSVVDLSELLPPERFRASAPGEQRPAGITSVDVEILGCDHGITFTLGMAPIELPVSLRPTVDQSACRSDPFCEYLKDGTGARAGTLGGAFICRRVDPAVGLPSVVADVPHPKADSVEVLHGQSENKAGSGKQSEATKFGEQASKSDHEGIENRAIEMLELASKILTSSSSLANRRRDRSPDGIPAELASCEDRQREQGLGASGRQKQVAEGPVADDAGRVFDALAWEGTSRVPHKTKAVQDRVVRVPTAGFRFEPTTGSVAWHRIAAVNVSKVEREGDLQTLKQFLPEVAVGDVDGHDIDANPGLLNAFRLAQLQAQYVLHCQQVLHRQCEGLQTAVTSMELEIKGNAQGTVAMRDRVRLLRKEGRRQDKIIAGYAAMLRKHNPGLASKVRLDEKGRLKVFDVDKASRQWEDGRRRRRRNRSRGGLDGLQVLRVQQVESSSSRGTSTDESRSGSLPTTNGNRWPKTTHRLSFPKIDSPQGHGDATASAGSKSGGDRVPLHRHDSEPRSLGHDRESRSPGGCEGHAAGALETQEAFLVERDRSGEGNSVGSATGVNCYGDGGGSDHRFNRNQDEVGSGPSAYQKHERTGEGTVAGPTISIPDGELVNRGDAARLQPSRDHGRETSAARGVGTRMGGFRAINSTAGSLSDRAKGLASQNVPIEDVSILRSENEDERVVSPTTEEKGQDEGPDLTQGPMPLLGTGLVGKTDVGVADEVEAVARNAKVNSAPRLVTVSVKPMRQPSRESTISPQFGREESESKTARDQGQVRPIIGVNAIRHGDGGGETVGGERAGEDKDTPTPGTSDNQAGVGNRAFLDQAGGRRGGGGGGDRDRFPVAALSAPSPVASPSRLGLEGDSFPDISEFDLDDISEIDVGGEWGTEGGQGPPSS